jgi:hypothetical protein
MARVFPGRTLILTAIFMLLCSTFAFAGADDVIGKARVTASAVQWLGSGNFESLRLTVTGPDGQQYREDFANGAALSFSPMKGAADGTYLYELRATPHISAEVRAQLRAARAAGDDDAISRIQTAAGIRESIVQSGAFTIHNGSLIPSDTIEPAAKTMAAPGTASSSTRPGVSPTTMDVVTADDAIIQGSLCVGLDCVNNESFGFDTIRLKENNTRIKFEDTSTGAGFPTTDWQLTANDSASGGQNKFSIEDITDSKVPFTVTGNAPTNSIFVASTGKVGFGNSAPVLNLHVTATDTPAIRQEQTNGGGFTAQTWDIGANEANWFVRDVTGGSRLPLRIRPGAPTSSVDISANGNTGVGTASPATKLDAVGTMRATNQTVPTGGAGTEIDYVPSGNTGTIRAFDRGAATYKNMAINDTVFVTGGSGGFVGIGVSSPTRPLEATSGAFLSAGGTWTNASSRSYKENIQDLDATSAMDALAKLNPVTYVYKVDPSEHHVGFIAEDVPALVATTDRKSLSPMDIVAVLTKAVQEQQKTINELKARMDGQCRLETVAQP